MKGAIVPGEVYVKLYREDEPLLGFDVLRANERKSAAAQTAPTPMTTPSPMPGEGK